MSAKTKISPIAIVVVLVAGIFAYGYGPRLLDAFRDQNAVTVLVDFTPNPRSGKTAVGHQFPDVVAILLTEGSVQHPKELVTVAPWSRVIYPKQRLKITVTASQVFGEKLSCVISRGKNTVSQDHKTKAAEVSCTYLYVPVAD